MLSTYKIKGYTMKSSDLVGKRLVFSSDEELQEFLKVTKLVHPNFESPLLLPSLSNLTVVKSEVVGDNPMYSRHTGYCLWYCGVLKPTVHASDVILEWETSANPTVDTVDILIMFLKKHRKFASFKRQFSSELRRYNLSNSSADTYIMTAFRWDKSVEGRALWSDLHKKLEAMCKSLGVPKITEKDNIKFLSVMNAK